MVFVKRCFFVCVFWDGTLRGAYIHDSAVDVAEFLEAKEPRAMSGVIERITLQLSVSHVPI